MWGGGPLIGAACRQNTLERRLTAEQAPVPAEFSLLGAVHDRPASSFEDQRRPAPTSPKFAAKTPPRRPQDPPRPLPSRAPRSASPMVTVGHPDTRPSPDQQATDGERSRAFAAAAMPRLPGSHAPASLPLVPRCLLCLPASDACICHLASGSSLAPPNRSPACSRPPTQVGRPHGRFFSDPHASRRSLVWMHESAEALPIEPSDASVAASAAADMTSPRAQTAAVQLPEG